MQPIPTETKRRKQKYLRVFYWEKKNIHVGRFTACVSRTIHQVNIQGIGGERQNTFFRAVGSGSFW